MLSTRAAGLGINLTSADICIFHDVDWNPEIDRQAEARCHRIGQYKPVTIYKLLMSHSIDEYIFKLAESKKERNNQIVGQEKATKPGSLKEDLQIGQILASLFSQSYSNTPRQSQYSQLPPQYSQRTQLLQQTQPSSIPQRAQQIQNSKLIPQSQLPQQLRTSQSPQRSPLPQQIQTSKSIVPSHLPQQIQKIQPQQSQQSQEPLQLAFPQFSNNSNNLSTRDAAPQRSIIHPNNIAINPPANLLNATVLKSFPTQTNQQINQSMNQAFTSPIHMSSGPNSVPRSPVLGIPFLLSSNDNNFVEAFPWNNNSFISNVNNTNNNNTNTEPKTEN